MTETKVHIFSREVDLSFIDVRLGDWVVIKPNLVKESKETDINEWRSVITSPELILQVTEYVAERIAPTGRITICDAPQTDSSFRKIAERLNLFGIANATAKRFGLRVDVVDLRNEEWTNEGGVIVERRKQAGDPEGAIAFDLGRNSLFYGFAGEGRYYGADYDAGVVNSHHRGERQEYLVCATPIKADVFINLPKMKTHKKTGVTLNLKNLVGINADKNWLPHHTEGSPAKGGDEFPDETVKRKLERISVKAARSLALSLPGVGPHIAKRMRAAGTTVFGDGKAVIRSGNWYGNDTTWRMVLDLNRCLLYGTCDGKLNINRRKRYYCIVDGRIGMDGMGPMQGDPVQSNLVIGGSDPAVVDLVTSRIMGFNWRKIPMINNAFGLNRLPITGVKVQDIVVESDIDGWAGRYVDIERKEFLHFRPHFGWAGRIEFQS